MKTFSPDGKKNYSMNIEIQYIKNENNVIADGYFRIIYKTPKYAINETIKKRLRRSSNTKTTKNGFGKQKHAFTI